MDFVLAGRAGFRRMDTVRIDIRMKISLYVLRQAILGIVFFVNALRELKQRKL